MVLLGIMREETDQGILNEAGADHFENRRGRHEQGPGPERVLVKDPDEQIESSESEQNICHILKQKQYT
jgi:hypothetical protein